jgi:hypothetical protein
MIEKIAAKDHSARVQAPPASLADDDRDDRLYRCENQAHPAAREDPVGYGVKYPGRGQT